MRRTLADIQTHARAALERSGHSAVAAAASKNCAWLEACGYAGLKMLAEALYDDVSALAMTRDAIGLDLQNISCVFIGPAIADDVRTHGRVFLRNVRHGLYLVPESVNNNFGIGCPVDPAFALGGERSKNPYAEKLAIAARDGVEIDEVLWQSLALRE